MIGMRTSHIINKLAKVLFWRKSLPLIGGLAAIVVLFWFGGNGVVHKDGWQAVFLDNGQVYFGRLAIADDFYILKQVYYLQSEENGKEKLDQISTSSVDISQKENLTKLIKLGKEIHGPKDAMFIQKSKILFWENLKDDSSVVRSIKDYESGF